MSGMNHLGPQNLKLYVSTTNFDTFCGLPIWQKILGSALFSFRILETKTLSVAFNTPLVFDKEFEPTIFSERKKSDWEEPFSYQLFSKPIWKENTFSAQPKLTWQIPLCWKKFLLLLLGNKLIENKHFVSSRQKEFLAFNTPLIFERKNLIQQ